MSQYPLALPTLDTFKDKVFEGDALTLLRSLPSGSVDMVLTDPPYNNTELHFDESIVDYEVFFAEAWRVLRHKDRACVLFAGGGLESTLKYEWRNNGYRYEWIWSKSLATGFFNANTRPLSSHEFILVFGQLPTVSGNHKNTLRYYPQMDQGKPYKSKRRGAAKHYNPSTHNMSSKNDGTRFPKSILFFSKNNPSVSLHPTQKPVDLLAYLINTYTRPGEVVLDPFGGSGSTAVAAIQTGRHFIIGDNHAPYCEIARQRIAAPIQLQMIV